ncbi:M1 family metallopeptidase [Gilvibacter sediminis]|uniref:M1 family metallopeptidase n=1 Tax=Gilvibacter sediminis TaxID=379071 RepID=UPI002350DF9A|nr:M1 family metallopeptidase [Gilvibacter sediminis]MDC7997907.1 M1 family metallopeptidase [Gilvibacter sediminis]
MRQVIHFTFILLALNCLGQNQPEIDFIKAEAVITPDFEQQKIHGAARYELLVIKDTDSIFLDAHIDELVTLFTSKGVTYSEDENKIWIKGDFNAGESFSFTVNYKVIPKQTLYFFENQLWTQGQGKYTSYWLPSLDDMTDKIEFDLSITAPTDYVAISNGRLTDKEAVEELAHWHFDMEEPMSSYLVMIAVGKYDKQELRSSSGVPLENYYFKGDKAYVEPTYRYTKEIFDFFERKIGVPYPWQNYKQVPVRDFLYAGMENTTATVFSSAFVVDSIGFNDKNYVNVNAHELAHQWFGNYVTEVSAADHWLHEGFASYHALLAERELFGDDYYYWKLFNTAEQLRSRSDNGKGEALSNPKASSLTFYEKGTWALIALDELLGSFDFDRVIKTYLERFAFDNATLDDFFAVVTEVTGKDMTEFRKQWIDQTSFKSAWALDYLTQSEFITAYLSLEALRTQDLSAKQRQLAAALNSENEYLGQEAVFQLSGEPMNLSLPLYTAALADEHVLVRQAVAQSLDNIPLAIKGDFEALLTDDSYVTQELALYRLWSSFPQDRAKYLDRMTSALGFKEKNVRQLWLTLAIVTPDYNEGQKRDYIRELMDYASDTYSFEVRELALNYLSEIQIINEQVLKSMINACVHPNWRFRNQARELLKRQLDNPIALQSIQSFRSDLPQKEQDYLQRVLE